MKTSLDDLNDGVGNLEKNQTQPRRNPEFIPNPEPQVYIPRRINLDDRVLRNVRMDDPSFDSSLDPIKLLDWIAEMEDYFECYQLDDRHLELDKMKLQCQFRCDVDEDELITFSRFKTGLREDKEKISFQRNL